jgi:hypothetical protein
MSNELKERHPSLMVPNVWTFGVVIYNNGSAGFPPDIPVEAIRQALIAALPPGTGVGAVTASDHGVYSGYQGGAK